MTPNVARLERLCEILGAVHPNHFNLKTWAGPTSCGTTACAVGFAALDPGFQAEGLSLEVLKSRFLFGPVRYVTVTAFDDVRGGWLRKSLGGVPRYRGYSHWKAVQMFFGLTVKQAFYLFSPERYDADELRAPDAVIGRIQKLLEMNQARVVPKMEPEVRPMSPFQVA